MINKSQINNTQSYLHWEFWTFLESSYSTYNFILITGLYKYLIKLPRFLHTETSSSSTKCFTLMNDKKIYIL